MAHLNHFWSVGDRLSSFTLILHLRSNTVNPYYWARVKSSAFKSKNKSVKNDNIDINR